MKVLANDGLAKSGIDALTAKGFTVITDNVPQNELIAYLNKERVTVLLVRSATTVRQDLIDACPSLKIIGRGGVGMDNIDVDYARSQGLHVINTPAASSHSVAELVFAHFMGLARFLQDANRNMPLEGESNFKGLKKKYAKGIELKGSTLGVLGFGRIGQATAAIGLRLGMKVLAYDPSLEKADIDLDFFDGQKLTMTIEIMNKESVLAAADFLSLHVPAQKGYVIGEAEFDLMKDGAFIANAARGGVVEEEALLKTLASGKLAGAALDVFENEPEPSIKLLMHPQISSSPHIGAATTGAQDRIGTELASQIVAILA